MTETKTKDPAPIAGAEFGASLKEESAFIKALFYGEPGSGKTTNAAHMAMLGKIVFVDTEQGLEGRALKGLGVPIENISVYEDVTYDGLETLFWKMRDLLSADPTSYAGVVIDTFSELQSKMLEEDGGGKFLYSQQDYGVNTSKLRLLMRKFRDLPCHVAFTTHVRRNEDQDDGSVRYRPALTPGAGGSLLGYCNLTCFCHEVSGGSDDEFGYVGDFRSDGKFAAKDRLHVLPPRLVKPTFDRIHAYVDGTYLRGAQKLADESSGEVPDGLDGLQFQYRQRIAAAKAAAVVQPQKAGQK
jgi:hypothetical protein